MKDNRHDSAAQRKHIFDVLHRTKKLDHGQIYVPKEFQKRLNLKDGDKVDVAFWEQFNELRIRKIRKARSR